MKTVRKLNIKDWSGYFFEEMINILAVNSEYFIVNDTKCINGKMIYNICYSDKIGVPHIVFNNIDCYFKKIGDYNFLLFCDNKKNKSMINIYLRIIKQLHDESEDAKFFFDGDSLKFRFKTDDNLAYDEKINIPVCVISLSSMIKKDWINCPIVKLQKCLSETFFKKKTNFFCVLI